MTAQTLCRCCCCCAPRNVWCSVHERAGDASVRNGCQINFNQIETFRLPGCCPFFPTLHAIRALNFEKRKRELRLPFSTDSDCRRKVTLCSTRFAFVLHHHPRPTSPPLCFFIISIRLAICLDQWSSRSTVFLLSITIVRLPVTPTRLQPESTYTAVIPTRSKQHSHRSLPLHGPSPAHTNHTHTKRLTIWLSCPSIGLQDHLCQRLPRLVTTATYPTFGEQVSHSLRLTLDTFFHSSSHRPIA